MMPPENKQPDNQSHDIQPLSDDSIVRAAHSQVDGFENQPQPVVFTDAVSTKSVSGNVYSRILRRLPKLSLLAASVLLFILVAGGGYAVLSHNQKTANQSATLTTNPSSPQSSNKTSTNNSVAPPSKKTVTTPAKKPTTTPAHSTVQKSVSSSTYSSPCNGCGPGISEEPPYVLGGADFYYGEADQIIDASAKSGATGASVEVTRADPKVNNPSDHSLVEMAVNIPGDYNLIEIGWIVDTAQFGDTLPHLFISRWIGRDNQCYVNSNDPACTFVQVSTTNTPNEIVSSSGTATFKTAFANNNWYVYYDGDEVGYFPESIWGSDHTKIFNVEIYGEVEAPPGTSLCIQMGNGKPGTEAGAVKVSNFTLYGSPVKAAFGTYGEIKVKHYYVGQTSPTGFSLGGPGVC